MVTKESVRRLPFLKNDNERNNRHRYHVNSGSRRKNCRGIVITVLKMKIGLSVILITYYLRARINTPSEYNVQNIFNREFIQSNEPYDITIQESDKFGLDESFASRLPVPSRNMCIGMHQ